MSQTQSAWIAFAEETLEQAESARRLRSYLQCFLTKCGFGLRNSEQLQKDSDCLRVLMIFACACKWEANEFPNCQGYESYNSLAEFFEKVPDLKSAMQLCSNFESSLPRARLLCGWLVDFGRAPVVLLSCFSRAWCLWHIERFAYLTCMKPLKSWFLFDLRLGRQAVAAVSGKW